MKQSGLLTIGTVAALIGAYHLYAAFVGPLTAPQNLPSASAAPAPAPEIKPLSIARRVAETHLTDYDWVADAKYQMQRGEETFIYFHSQRRIGDDKQNKMRVSPFAVVWMDPDSGGEEAYTLVCESAVIEFLSKVQLGMSGRIVGGQLDGTVRVTGPDGLDVVGQNFLFSEKALRLHSDHPIQFAFGPRPGDFEQVRGRAERVDVTLDEATESVLGNDLPRVGGLRRVALGKNVSLNLVMDDHGQPAPVLAMCKTQLIYDVEQMIATFVDDVRVRRTTDTTDDVALFDWLECDHLQLMFTDKKERDQTLANGHPLDGKVVPASATRSGNDRDNSLGISLDLEFQRLSAIGENLKLGSDENSLTARMEQLFYDVDARAVEMRHTTGDVVANYRSDVLTCPFIRLRHDDDDKIQAAECRGVGAITRNDAETGEVEVECSWSDFLVMRPDEDPTLNILEISGDGRVLQPPQKTGIIADRLRVWVDSEAVQSGDGDLKETLSGVDSGDPLPLRKVVATSNVALVSPHLHLETQSLESTFVVGEVVESQDSRDPVSGRRKQNGEKGHDEQPVVVAASSVAAHLVYDPVSENMDVVRLNAADGVTISRASEAAAGLRSATDDPFSIEAEKLELRNRNGAHVLRLLGAPARIRHPEAEIEGNEMYFDRGANMAMVEGEGSLLVLVDSDLEGETLEVPEPLSVRWHDQMKFDGERADFLGDVRTSLKDSSMRCNRMTISLDRRLSFSEEAAQAEDLKISRIACFEGVKGQYVEWENADESGREASKLIGMRMIEMADFTFDCISGDIHAQGPGQIDDWRLGGEQQRIRISPVAATDERETSKRDDAKWEFTRVNFSGQMTGNQRDRYLTLSDRIRVMHGPVERAMEVIDRDEFARDTRQSRNSIWIGSDTLQVRLVPGEGDAPDTASVLAKGNAELQGKVMGARADSISFDQAKEMFTLRGRGTEAYLWHQEKPGSRTREMSAKTIQFVPSKHEITIDGTRGIQGAQ